MSEENYLYYTGGLLTAAYKDLDNKPTTRVKGTVDTWNRHRLISVADALSVTTNGGTAVLGGDWLGHSDIADVKKATIFFKTNREFSLEYQMSPGVGATEYYTNGALFVNQAAGEYFETIEVNGGDLRFVVTNHDANSVLNVTDVFVRLQF